MPFLISNATSQTWLVIAILAAITIFTIRKKTSTELFPLNATLELKGLAILLVILSHIGYFLVDDHRFLVPLSNYAGVGVDLFLILSGYGLTVSLLRKPHTAFEFYRKRLSKIYVPVIFTVGIFTILDACLLRRFYPISLTIKNLLGIFPHADLFNDVNSPLWFITIILTYYLLFPLLFIRRAPWVTALLFAGIGSIVVIPGFLEKLFSSFTLTWIYRLHLFAFPLGIALATFITTSPWPMRPIRLFFARHQHTLYFRPILQYAGLILCLALFIGSSYYSFVGGSWLQEEVLSLAVSLLIISFWILKPFEIRFLHLVGIYSFEIYLMHWPLLARYDIAYFWLPSGVATLCYLGLFIGLSALYVQGIEKIRSYVTRRYTRLSASFLR